MFTLHCKVSVAEDRKLVVTLPPEVPVGELDIELTVREPSEPTTRRVPSLMEWAEANARKFHDAFNSEDVESFTGRRY